MKPHHRRDFIAYLKFYWNTDRSFYPTDYPVVDYDKKTNCIRAFIKFDGTGRYYSCKQPNVFRAALIGKAKLNLQIKQWANGYYDCGGRFYIENELKEKFYYLPDWVWTALYNQVRSKLSDSGKILFDKISNIDLKNNS